MCELREQIPRKERDCGQAERDVRAPRANPLERTGLPRRAATESQTMKKVFYILKNARYEDLNPDLSD